MREKLKDLVPPTVLRCRRRVSRFLTRVVGTKMQTFPVSKSEDDAGMMCPYEYNIRFVSIRIICPKTREVFIEAQRSVDFIHIEPDWAHLDEVISTFLEAHGVDVITRLPEPEVQPGGGWATHSFDMGCPRMVWIYPEPPANTA